MGRRRVVFFGWICLGFLIAGILTLLHGRFVQGGIDDGRMHVAHDRGGPQLIARQPSRPLTKAIERIRVGDRVLGKNPLLSDFERIFSEPEPVTWRTVELRLIRPNGKRIEVTLLRDLTWLEAVGARVCGFVHLKMPEMGADGEAEVLRIGPCPPISRGSGNIVTGTFRSEPDDNLVNVWVEGLDEPIGCTSNHPFWSEDREDFVPAGKLQREERLNSVNGTRLRVITVRSRRLEEFVYNLEVDGEHVYHISPLHILVHNNFARGQIRSGAKTDLSRRCIIEVLWWSELVRVGTA